VGNEDEWCQTIRLEEKDLLVYEIDRKLLCGAIAQAIGLELPAARSTTRARAELAGTHGPGRYEVYLMFPADSARMAREVERLFGVHPTPFILLTPSGAHFTADVESALHRQHCTHIPLSGIMDVRADGILMANESAAVMLKAFAKRTEAAVMRMPGEGNTATGSTHPALPAGAKKKPLVFERKGRYWEVVLDGAPDIHIENTLGARYLDYLLHHQSEVISAYDLEIAVTPAKKAARQKNTIQAALDPDATRAYLRELNRLRDSRSVAEDEGRQHEAEEIGKEITDIEGVLKNKDSIGTDSGERSRGNVSKAINAVQRKLAKGEKHEKAFGDHIKQCISMGYSFRYCHPSGGVWQ
jgi:hypothetical protein